MQIGIMADTHDNLPLVDKAIERFNQSNVRLVLHAGDYIAPFTVVRFKRLKARLIGVFGNNDGDFDLLKKRFGEVEGAEVRGRFAEVTINGVRAALLHGHETELLQSIINTGSYSLVAHGHSHEASIWQKGKTTIINPGEVCGYLSGKSTLAILDTETLRAKIVQLQAP